ncbi:hypothetical protein [Mesorhizobium silamurunense]|uniref:hypothetical protein n=1 Tax=Mesorhizobium silamurunense TaxID=499528 RepID=UPI001781531D|nr:hypothetical protein [Mesorhizobium silamurunense]
MRRVDADNKLFPAIARKLHFELPSFIGLQSCSPGFFNDLAIKPFANRGRLP